MTKEREELIAKFQRWLDTEPLPKLIAYECANIAEAYATSREQEAWNAAMSEFSQRLTAHTLGEPREFKTIEDWRKEK